MIGHQHPSLNLLQAAGRQLADLVVAVADSETALYPQYQCYDNIYMYTLLPQQTNKTYTCIVVSATVQRKPSETETMSHILESCPLTKLNGRLSRLHSADEGAVLWLTSYGS